MFQRINRAYHRAAELHRYAFAHSMFRRTLWRDFGPISPRRVCDRTGGTANYRLSHAGTFSCLELRFELMSKVVSQNPDILGGEPVFVGTRVPVKSLFDHLEAGDSIEEFLEGFPSVKREQVIALLEEAREHALAAS